MSINSLLRYTFIFILIAFALFMWPALGANSSLQLIINAGDDAWVEQVNNHDLQPSKIQELTFRSDVFFAQQEFEYLVGFKAGSTITQQELERAITHLLKKSTFQTITITITPGQDGIKIHFGFVGQWTFGRLKLHGILLGKDAYRQYYLMESGEPFDQEKHEQSLVRIKEVFAGEGYLQGDVTAELKRHEATKSITVNLYLKKGPAFSVGDLQVELRNTSSLPSTEVAPLLAKLEEKFFKRMRKSYYNKTLLTDRTSELKRYLCKQGFVQVAIELVEQIDRQNHDVNLKFILELSQRKEFTFVGNQFFSEDVLLDTLMLFGDSAWFLPTSIFQQELLRLYKKKGFWSVAITEREEHDRVIFLIHEGERATVDKVRFKQVKSFDPAFLSSHCFSPFLKAHYFDQDLFDQGLDALQAYYQSQGFLEFEVVKHTHELSKDFPESYIVVITVQEGEQTFLDSVTVAQYPELNQQGPFTNVARPELKAKTGSALVKPMPFNMQIIYEQRAWLVQHFNKKGCWSVVATPEFSTTAVAATADTKAHKKIAVIWHVQCEESIRFGKTIIQGSSTVPFDVIARELDYQEGDLWNKERIKNSLGRLRSMDIFESISLYPDSASSATEKTMILKLQKDDPFELRLRGGFAAQQLTRPFANAGITYRAGGSFFIKNPLNLGDQIRFDADVDRSQRSFTAQYQIPWFFNKPVKTVLQGYSNKYLQPAYISGQKNLYEVTQQGFLVGFAKKKMQHDAGVTLGLEFMETTVGKDCCEGMFGHGIARAINFAPRLLDKKIPYVTAEPTWIVDLVDNRLQPTRGTFTLFSAKAMVPVAQLSASDYFVRFVLEQSVFVPYRSLVFAMRARVGHIFHQQLSTIMPSERFYLGGANSIRSYDVDRCPPLGSFVDCDGQTRFVPQGAKSMANVNLELRIPVYKNVAAVLFQDLGALSGDKLVDFWKEEGVLAATGFGIRYNTPIGPLRFDVGWNWHKAYPEQPRYAWFLTLGNAF